MTELLAGRISGEAEDLFAVEFITPAKPWVDPQKDASAEELALRLGLKSRRQAVAEQGWDIEALDAEIAADRARETALGLKFGDSDSDSDKAR
jgi:capsid protein